MSALFGLVAVRCSPPCGSQKAQACVMTHRVPQRLVRGSTSCIPQQHACSGKTRRGYRGSIILETGVCPNRSVMVAAEGILLDKLQAVMRAKVSRCVADINELETVLIVSQGLLTPDQ